MRRKTYALLFLVLSGSGCTCDSGNGETSPPIKKQAPAADDGVKPPPFEPGPPAS